MASLTETVHQLKGSTVLYVPVDRIDDPDSAARDKDLLQTLECAFSALFVSRLRRFGRL